MSVPLGHINGRNLVIASVGTSTEPSINYQESQELPTERPNGGDLLPGDLWYNENDDTLYIFTTMGWGLVGVSTEYVDAIGQDLADRIQKLDTLSATTSEMVLELESTVDAMGLDLADRIQKLDTLSAATSERVLELESTVDAMGLDLADRIQKLDILAATLSERIDELELTSATKTELTTEIDNLKTEVDAVAFKVTINETALTDHEQRLMDGGL